MLFEDFVWVLQIFATVQAAIEGALGNRNVDQERVAAYVRDEFLKMEAIRKKMDDWSRETGALRSEIEVEYSLGKTNI